MRKILLFFITVQITIYNYGQIIADHTVVDKYGDIPQEYIDEVKKMLVDIAGESHSSGYTIGMNLLKSYDSRFQVSIYTSSPPPLYTSSYLRFGRHGTVGEQTFFTNSTAISNYKLLIQEQADLDNSYSVMGFAWCSDLYYGALTTIRDPLYNVSWGGQSIGGPEGNLPWGLDADDFSITNNTVCMDTYLAAIEEYNQYCITNEINTKVIFTTGPVDNGGGSGNLEGTEKGYLREVKHDYIRDYVRANGGILFDYADILCWSDAGEQHITYWNDGGTSRSHANIHPQNESKDYNNDWEIIEKEIPHYIGEVGLLRLSKAMWWMLARIAGWDGTIDGEDTTPPSMPTVLSLNALSMNSISFSWSASSDNVAVTGYNVFRNGAFIGNTITPIYSDNTLTECAQYNYTVSAFDEAGNESEHSQGLLVRNCQSDLTPTLIVSPNIGHGITAFNLLVRVTELNNVSSDGPITVNIPADARWDLEEDYNSSLEILNDMTLNNSDWTYSRNETNHIFSSSLAIPAGGSSTFGFTIVFNPDTSRGLYTVTSQLVPGSGGEIRSSNNADSERLDYFQ
jgi:hypothetical protein